MKRVVFSILGGLACLAFYWGLPFLVELITPPGNAASSTGEGSASAQLWLYFVAGGSLFLLLGAWIGWTAASSWAKSGRMTLGVLLGCFLLVVLPRFFTFPESLQWQDWRLDAVFLFVWWLVCVALAYFFGRSVQKPSSSVV